MSAAFDHLHPVAGAPESDDQQLLLLVDRGQDGLGEVESEVRYPRMFTHWKWVTAASLA